MPILGILFCSTNPDEFLQNVREADLQASNVKMSKESSHCHQNFNYHLLMQKIFPTTLTVPHTRFSFWRFRILWAFRKWAKLITCWRANMKTMKRQVKTIKPRIMNPLLVVRDRANTFLCPFNFSDWKCTRWIYQFPMKFTDNLLKMKC